MINIPKARRNTFKNSNVIVPKKKSGVSANLINLNILNTLNTLINLICGIFVIETYNISDHTRTILWNIEVIIVIFLIIEYIARLYGAPNRIKQLYNIYGIIDLIAILPTIIFFIPFISLDINYIRLIRV